VDSLRVDSYLHHIHSPVQASHVLASAFNVLFKPLDQKVVLEPIPLEALEAMESEDPSTLAYEAARP